MTSNINPPEGLIDINEQAPDAYLLTITPRLDVGNAADYAKRLRAFFHEKAPRQLDIDLSKIESLDDFGVAVLACLKRDLAEFRCRFNIIALNDHARKVLSLHHFDELDRLPLTEKRHANLFTITGEQTFRFFDEIKNNLIFLGESCFACLNLLRKPTILRGSDTINLMSRVGVDAVPIVVLISLLLGLIMAFMSAVQLQQFGANIYVASLVSLSMTRELGPIMTAIIVAGRSASSFASEIGTMKISEEIDALHTMGFNPHHFLVLPRMTATLLVLPVLTMFSDISAIFGGLVVGVGMLDLTIDGYINQTLRTLKLFDVFYGLFKSGIFAMLISWTGCYKGFHVHEGAAGVGRATTEAVVMSIFLIILSDSILVVVLRYWL